MGFFDVRSSAERKELKKAKKSLKSAREANRRDLEIGRIEDRTRLLKAKKGLAKAKAGKRKAEKEEWRGRLPRVTVKAPKIKRKKQGRSLGRKRKIRLI